VSRPTALCSYVADGYRLLAKASDTALGGPHFHKTLEQIDQTTLVRDRGGWDQRREPGEEEDEEYQEEPAVPEIKEEEPARDGPPKTDRQQALEAEWGLYRSPQLSQNVEDEDEDETDDERRRDTLKSTEEDFMVCQYKLCKLMI
jgi:hypothetical protein